MHEEGGVFKFYPTGGGYVMPYYLDRVVVRITAGGAEKKLSDMTSEVRAGADWMIRWTKNVLFQERKIALSLSLLLDIFRSEFDFKLHNL